MLEKPAVLHLFSGRPDKDTSLSKELLLLSIPCNDVDKKLPGNFGDLVDDMVWGYWRSQLLAGLYKGLGAGPPCGTFSHSRSYDPGPAPLRDATHVTGLPDLNQAQKLELRLANVLVDRAAEAAEIMYDQGAAGFLENPLAVFPGQASFFDMPKIMAFSTRPGVRVAKFHMCRNGASSTKPTQILYWYMDLSGLDGKWCNHPIQDWVDLDTTNGLVHYRAAHQRLVRRKVGRQWASEASADYPDDLNRKLAASFAVSFKATAKRQAVVVVD
jgi:hypothetical protein